MERASQSGAKWLFTVLTVSKILFSHINKLTASSANAAYMQAIFQGVCAAAVFVILCLAAGENADILSCARDAFGKTGQTLFGGAVSVILLAEGGIMLRTYGDIIASVALPEASGAAIALAVASVAAVAVFHGTAPLVSYCRGAGIVLTGALAAILALNLPNCSVSNIYPVFGNGAGGIFRPDGLELYGDMLILFLMAGELGGRRCVMKTGLKAILLSASVTAVCTFFYVLTVPYQASAAFSLPILEMAFGAKLSVLFQRTESIFLFLWIFSSFALTAVYTAFSVKAFAESFDISDKRALTPIFTLSVLAVALAAKSPANNAPVYDKVYSSTALSAAALFLAVFVIGRIKRRMKI